MMTIGIYFLTFCCLGLQYVTTAQLIKTKHMYLTFRTKLNGIQNLSYAFTSKSGLSGEDKQALLDMTNALRNYIAQGKEMNSKGGRMPIATNMMAVEWDDDLADFAQRHTLKARLVHSNLKLLRKGKYKDSSLKENLSGGVLTLDRDMYGEVVDWDYERQDCDPTKQCGHYLAIVSWASFRMGCGFHSWKKNSVHNSMVACIFAPFATAGVYLTPSQTRRRFQYEYWKGTAPCTECPQGFDYCMGGGLCATKEQCDSDSNNNCVCTHTESECKANGGRFDNKKCQCTCPKNRMGKNCASSCQDMPFATSCGAPCQQTTREIFLCPKTCGSCGSAVSRVYTDWVVNRRASNRDNVKTRATPPKPEPPVPTNVQTSSLPNRGKCKNKESDYFCEHIRRLKYCNHFEDKDRWQHFCGASCDSCGSKGWTGTNNKEAGGSGSGTSEWKDVTGGDGWGDWEKPAGSSGGDDGSGTYPGSSGGDDGWKESSSSSGGDDDWGSAGPAAGGDEWKSSPSSSSGGGDDGWSSEDSSGSDGEWTSDSDGGWE